MAYAQVVRIGTRGSLLARRQAEHVAQLLAQRLPDLRIEVAIVSTVGDRMADRSLPSFGDKGVFTSELEDELRSGAIDLAVHSLKDLPTEPVKGLVLAAFLERADPADVVVSRGGYRLDDLPRGASVGTSSTRRRAQVLHRRPDLRLLDLRGNADTRLQKAMDPEAPYDAIIVARAALERLCRLDAISETLCDDLMLPAPGQGALVVQCRDELESLELILPLNHTPTELEAEAERSFLQSMGGGCATPVAARAKSTAGRLSIRGRVCAVDGSVAVDVEAARPLTEAPGMVETARSLGRELAARAADAGAVELLAPAVGAIRLDGSPRTP